MTQEAFDESRQKIGVAAVALRFPCACKREIPATHLDTVITRGVRCSVDDITYSAAEALCFEMIAPSLTGAAAVPKTLARNSDPSPSHEGAVDVAERVGDEQQRAWVVVVGAPGHTANELSKQIGDPDPRRLNRRLGEIEKKGRVRRGDVRRCSVSGRNAATWWPVCTPTGIL